MRASFCGSKRIERFFEESFLLLDVSRPGRLTRAFETTNRTIQPTRLIAIMPSKLDRTPSRVKRVLLADAMRIAAWRFRHGMKDVGLHEVRQYARAVLRCQFEHDCFMVSEDCMVAMRRRLAEMRVARRTSAFCRRRVVTHVVLQTGKLVSQDETVRAGKPKYVMRPCAGLVEVYERDGWYVRMSGQRVLISVPTKLKDFQAEKNRQRELFEQGVIDNARYHKNMRTIRDMEQVRAARERERVAYKLKPKREREDAVFKARSDKFADKVQLESGKHVVVGAAASLLIMQIAKVFRKGNQLINKADAVISMVKDIVDMAKKQLGKARNLMWAIPVIVAFYFVVKRIDIPFPAKMAIAASLPCVLPKLYRKVVTEYFSFDGELQSGCDTMGRLLASIFALATFGKGFRSRDVTEFMKRVSLFDRFSTNFGSMVEWFISSFENMVNYLRSKSGKKPISLLRKELSPLQEWQREIDACDERITLCGKTIGGSDKEQDIVELVNQMVALYARGRDYKEIHRGDYGVCKFIDLNMLRLKELIRPYQGSLNARNNFRVEPECMLITGAPGIGKTVVTSHIAVAILRLSGLVISDSLDDYMQHVWQKTQSSYWNGYTGQHAVIMDDMLQFRGDPTDVENEYMTLIRTVSSWACPLEFADVDSKGKNYFVSKFILGTCNTVSFASSAKLFVHEPEAVARRIHHQYKMELDSAFANEQGRLDMVKYQAELDACKGRVGLDAYPWHIWVVRKHNFITGVTSDEVLSLKDVVMKAAENLRAKLQAHGDMRGNMNNFIAGLSAGVESQAGNYVRVVELDGHLEKGENGIHTFEGMLRFVHGDAERHRLAWAVVGALGAAFLWYKLIRTVLNMLWGLLCGAFGLGSNKKKAVQLQSNAKVQQSQRQRSVTLQAGDTIIVDKAYANTYKMVVPMDEGVYVVGQVMFVNDKLAVQPQHFTDSVKELLDSGRITLDSEITFQHCLQDRFGFGLTARVYLNYARDSYPDLDVEFIRFEDVRAHSKIENFFLTEKQVRSYVAGHVSARMDMCEVETGGRFHEPRRNVIHLARLAYSESPFCFRGNRRLNRYFSYTASTDVGYCGAPISLVDNRSFSGHTVFGIHVAGSRERHVGYCAVVTKEMIEKARLKLRTLDDCFHEDLSARGVDYQAGGLLPFGSLGSFLPIGVLAKPITLCPVTSYYKTDLYGVFGPYEYSPAALSSVVRDGEVVYPMVRAVEPYATPVKIFDRDGFDQISHVAFSRLSAVCPNANNRIFTFEEAILGIGELKFRSIPRNTSPGFPYCYDNGSGKTAFFGDGEQYDLTGPKCNDLRVRVDKIVDMAKKGQRSAVLFNDFLKDELRSKKKNDQVATRLISSAPLDYVVAWRMYFGDFSARVMGNNIFSGMAPGICAYSDWTTLGHFLTKKGEKVFAGDFKSFDSSQQASIMEVILDYINRWYDDGEENATVRTVLWQDLLHSRHIGGVGNDQRYIYQWNKSLPSGHPFTTILNSMYSLFCLVACYVRLTGDWTHFWSKVHAITYGDDNVVNVIDELSPVYNQRSVAATMMELFGMVYTSDDKDGELIETTTLDRVTFLKRRFRIVSAGYVCPLELDSFLYCVYWGKNRRLENRIICDELENALEELSMHEPDTWKRYANAIYGVLVDRLNRYSVGVPKATCTQKEYLRIVLSRSDNWY